MSSGNVAERRNRQTADDEARWRESQFGPHFVDFGKAPRQERLSLLFKSSKGVLLLPRWAVLTSNEQQFNTFETPQLKLFVYPPITARKHKLAEQSVPQARRRLTFEK